MKRFYTSIQSNNTKKIIVEIFYELTFKNVVLFVKKMWYCKMI